MKQHYFVVVLAHSLHGRLRRIHVPHPAPEEIVVLALAVCHTAQRRAHHRADPVLVLPGQVQLGVGQGHAGGGDAELGIAVQPAGAAILDVIGRVEAVHLAGDGQAWLATCRPMPARVREAMP